MDGFPSGQRGQTVNLLQIAFGGSNPPPSIRRSRYLSTCDQQVNNVAGWSSLEARRAHNPKVVGSNPAPATRVIIYSNAQIAQLVEQRTENPRVAGSIPALGTLYVRRDLCCK